MVEWFVCMTHAVSGDLGDTMSNFYCIDLLKLLCVAVCVVIRWLGSRSVQFSLSLAPNALLFCPSECIELHPGNVTIVLLHPWHQRRTPSSSLVAHSFKTYRGKLSAACNLHACTRIQLTIRLHFCKQMQLCTNIRPHAYSR